MDQPILPGASVDDAPGSDDVGEASDVVGVDVVGVVDVDDVVVDVGVVEAGVAVVDDDVSPSGLKKEHLHKVVDGFSIVQKFWSANPFGF